MNLMSRISRESSKAPASKRVLIIMIVLAFFAFVITGVALVAGTAALVCGLGKVVGVQLNFFWVYNAVLAILVLVYALNIIRMIAKRLRYERFEKLRKTG